VSGQIGRAADIVRWYAEAYNDIQRERDGRWKWLYADFQLLPNFPVGAYAYGLATDVAAGGAISRFRSWALDPRNPPLIYRPSEGIATQAALCVEKDWFHFKRHYLVGAPAAAKPVRVCEDPHGRLVFSPSPNVSYTVDGQFFRSPQLLIANADVPEMPSDFHMLIVYRAMTKYGYDQVAPEILSRAAYDGESLYNALVMDQAWDRFSFTVACPLA
jgi:hypothetical protein